MISCDPLIVSRGVFSLTLKWCLTDTNQGFSSNAWVKQSRKHPVHAYIHLAGTFCCWASNQNIRASKDRARGLLFLPLAYSKILKSTEIFCAAFHYTFQKENRVPAFFGSHWACCCYLGLPFDGGWPMRVQLSYMSLRKEWSVKDATVSSSSYIRIGNVLPSAELMLIHTAPQTHAAIILPNLASSLTSKVAP